MGVSTRDIFGDPAGTEPAAPGTYGEAPRGHRLPAATRLGPVRLQVADLGRSLAYYQSVLGLRVLEEDRSHAALGPHGDDRPLVALREHAAALPAPRHGMLGLYHFAILLPDRAALGRFVRHLGAIGAEAGAADHRVSEALYLQDPDNLGIEVYADRPRERWQRKGRELVMASDPLDFEGLLGAAGDAPWSGMPAGTTIGHVHLHVGDIADASRFFSDVLGFDRTVWEYPGALFLAAGGYHHHLGTNPWAGRGATPPTPHHAQLLEWTIELPDAASLDAVEASLTRAGHEVRREGGGGPRDVLTRDPWGTPIRITEARRS